VTKEEHLDMARKYLEKADSYLIGDSPSDPLPQILHTSPIEKASAYAAMARTHYLAAMYPYPLEEETSG
jgi:hypothetical protein